MDDNELDYVGFWARFGATLIDVVLILVIAYPFLFLVYGDDYFYSDALIQGPADFFINYVFPTVAIIWFWYAKQATPGKMVIGAKILDAESGNVPSIGQLIGRYFAYFLSTIPLCLGYVWIAFDPKKQAWHDKLAGTVVVRLKDRQPRKAEFN